ncbi:MAG: hypothetical protein H3Z52_14840 [archaeon]|nr:hypothetical protein [archaeon]MCP8322192.1 hypothetical protein [archaeon]
MSEKSYDRDIAELRERITRLEIQFAEIVKRVDGISNYTRQLFDYLNRMQLLVFQPYDYTL